jgi:arylsulfatase A-like enzyme
VIRIVKTPRPILAQAAWAMIGGAATALALYFASLREYGAGDAGPAGRFAIEHYLVQVLLANAKLALLLVLAGAAWGLVAAPIVRAAASLLGRHPSRKVSFAAGGAMFLAATARALVARLVEAPASVVVVWPYATSRLDPLWDHATPLRVALATALAVAAGVALVVAGEVAALRRGEPSVVAAVRKVLTLARRPHVVVAAAAAAAVVPIGVLGFFALPGHARPASARPNVIVLLSDSLRADRIGAVRDGVPVTPAIDRLAARGTTFANYFVPVARTTESLVTLVTGTWPSTHGVRTSWIGPEQRALPVPSFMRSLAASGYECWATGDWSGCDFAKFDGWFDRTEVPPETWSMRTLIARGGRLTALLVKLHYTNALGEWLCPEVFFYPGAHATPSVTRRVFSRLDHAAQSGRPQLIVAFYGPTHAPFTAAGEHIRRFADPEYRGPNRYCLMAKTIDEAVSIQNGHLRRSDLQQVQAIYDASVRTFDDEVARVVARLEELDLDRRTIVIVSSDHGTAFYERGSFGQGNEIASDVSNRVPLVVLDPRSPQVARRVSQVVREVDVAPTILDLAGAPCPPSVEGVSLRPLLSGPPRELGLLAYGETGLWIGKQPWQSEELDFGFPSIFDMVEVPDLESGWIATQKRWVKLMIRAQHRMVRDARWKLLYVPTRTSVRITLYDLASPQPERDVAALHPDVVDRLKKVLESFIAREPADAFTAPLPPPRLAHGGRRLG